VCNNEVLLNHFALGEWKREEIGAGSKINLDFPVSIESIKGSTQLLKWKIISEDYDIGLEVTFWRTDPKMNSEIVREFRQIDSHVEPVEGSLVCEEAGTYRVTLDNTYSRFRNKTVIHRIGLSQVSGPDPDETVISLQKSKGVSSRA